MREIQGHGGKFGQHMFAISVRLSFKHHHGLTWSAKVKTFLQFENLSGAVADRDRDTDWDWQYCHVTFWKLEFGGHTTRAWSFIIGGIKAYLSVLLFLKESPPHFTSECPSLNPINDECSSFLLLQFTFRLRGDKSQKTEVQQQPVLWHSVWSRARLRIQTYAQTSHVSRSQTQPSLSFWAFIQFLL